MGIYLLLFVEFSRTLLPLFLLALALLQQGLRDEDLVFSWHAPISRQERQCQYSLSARIAVK